MKKKTLHIVEVQSIFIVSKYTSVTFFIKSKMKEKFSAPTLENARSVQSL